MDKKKLVEILKENGLNIAEEAATTTVKGIFKSIKEIVKATPSKTDDLLIPLIAVIEPPILALIDKIDGEDN